MYGRIVNVLKDKNLGTLTIVDLGHHGEEDLDGNPKTSQVPIDINIMALQDNFSKKSFEEIKKLLNGKLVKVKFDTKDMKYKYEEETEEKLYEILGLEKKKNF